jgi:hypothetical protein
MKRFVEGVDRSQSTLRAALWQSASLPAGHPCRKPRCDGALAEAEICGRFAWRIAYAENN